MAKLWAGRSRLRILAAGNTYPFSKCQISSEAHPASYSMSIRGKGWRNWLQHDVDHSICLALRLREAILLLPPPSPSGLPFMDTDNFTITASLVVNCVRSLIPKDSGLLLKFYDFVHPHYKPLPGKLTQLNLDFTSLRGPFKMYVKSRKM